MIFRRRTGPDAEFPLLERAAADRFRTLVRDEVGRRHGPCRIEDGVARTADRSYGLENLSRLLAPLPPEQWPTAVAGHLDSIDRGLDGPPPALDPAMLMPRIRRAAETMPGTVQRPLADDLVSVLCLDEPERVTTPSADALEALGPLPELAARAMANLHQHLGAEPVTRHELSTDGVPVLACSSDSFFLASAPLLPDPGPWLARWQGDGPDHGHVVAVPGRHLLLSAAVEGISVVPAIRLMVDLAGRHHDTDPGPISPHLYWVRDHRWHRISHREGDRVTLTPGPELEAMLG